MLSFKNILNYVLASLFTFLFIICCDIYLLRKVKEQNKNKLILSESFNNNACLLNDFIKREERITRMVIVNALCMILVRAPEIIANSYQLFQYFGIPPAYFLFNFCQYTYCGNLNELGEYVFPLNGIFQFIVFNKFNSKFRESFKEIRQRFKLKLYPRKK